MWSGILDNLSHPSECEPDVSESRGPLLQTIPSVSVSGSMSLYWGCQGVSKTAKPLEILEKTDIDTQTEICSCRNHNFELGPNLVRSSGPGARAPGPELKR